MKTKLAILLLFILTFTACNPSEPATQTPQMAATEILDQTPVTPEPLPPTEEPSPTPTETPFDLQPATGQRIEFETEDGTVLVGYFYPAIIPNAPVVILMHWAGGDQRDWMDVGMVQWLQNRLDENPIPETQEGVYPDMPPGVSFAVFTFDFRDYGESQPFPGVSFAELAAGWLLDARAAYQTASEMSGVDPTRLAGLGSSIGADAVVDACIQSLCLGTFSVSPGGFLQIPYQQAVTELAAQEWITIPEAGGSTSPIFCVASEGDIPSSDVCKSVKEDWYQYVLFAGELHGTLLLQAPNNPPEIGQLMQEWLFYTFGITEPPTE